MRSRKRPSFYTATYDATICAYLNFSEHKQSAIGTIAMGTTDDSLSAGKANIDRPEFSLETFYGSLPSRPLRKSFSLRYGENPHQEAALYQTASCHGVGNAKLLSGKEMSFNNYVDADAAWQLVLRL